jgi:hypothetical protein
MTGRQFSDRTDGSTGIPTGSPAFFTNKYRELYTFQA